jgi:predicted transposase YdaD
MMRKGKKSLASDVLTKTAATNGSQDALAEIRKTLISHRLRVGKTYREIAFDLYGKSASRQAGEHALKRGGFHALSRVAEVLGLSLRVVVE